jgi:heme O synthase-like polyprenyltransferase
MATTQTPPEAPVSANAHPVTQGSLPSRWRQFYVLTKPRVVQLIVFCAMIGMLLAVPGVPSADECLKALAACVGIWLVAGAAAAFNCLIEQGIDSRMKRTAWRPTARGELTLTQSLTFSMVLCALGGLLLYVAVNPLTLWLTLGTFVGYAIVYTVILKPLTPQNPWQRVHPSARVPLYHRAAGGHFAALCVRHERDHLSLERAHPGAVVHGLCFQAVAPLQR